MRSQISKSLGVDLIEIKKANFFYRTHRNRLSSFFTDNEISYIQRSDKQAETFGILMAAKEAVFKALPHRQTGMIVFRTIEILPAENGRLHFRLKNAKENNRLSLQVIKHRKYVIVQCAGTS